MYTTTFVCSCLWALAGLTRANAYPFADRPVIGILSENYHGKSRQQVMATYARFYNMSGVYAIPIMSDLSPSSLGKLYEVLSAVVIPGGGNVGDHYTESANRLLEMSKSGWDKGSSKPTFVTCYGFETAMHHFDSQIRKQHLGAKANLAVSFTKSQDAFQITRGMTRELFNNMERKNFAVNHHSFGFDPSDFRSSSFFQVVATSSFKGKTFAAMIRPRNESYLLYGTQHHPERCESKGDDQKSCLNAQAYLSNFYTDLAKKNSSPFPKPLLDAILELPYKVIDYGKFFTKERPTMVYSSKTRKRYKQLIKEYLLD